MTYINPAIPDVATMPTHGALESADIICPNTLVYQRGTAEDDEVYKKLVERAYRLPEEGGTTEAEADQFKSGLWFQMKAPETPDNLRLQAIEFLEDLNRK